MRARPKILLVHDATRRPRPPSRATTRTSSASSRTSSSRAAAAKRRTPASSSRGACAPRTPTCRSCSSRRAPRTRRSPTSVGAAFLLQGLADLLLERAAPAHARGLRLRRLRLPPAGRRRGRPRRGPARRSRSSSARVPDGASSTTPSATTSRTGSRRAPSSRSPTSCGRASSRDFPTLEALRADLIALDRRPTATSARQAIGRRLRPRDLRLASATSTASAAARSAARRAAWPSCAGCSPSAGLRRRFPGVEVAVPAGGGARDRRVRPLPRRERPARLRDRVRRRRGDRPPLPRRRRFPEEAERDLAAFLERVARTRSRCAPRACSRTRSTSRSPASTRRYMLRQQRARRVAERLRAARDRRSSGSTPRPSRGTPRPTCARRPTGSRRRRWR